MDEFIESLDKAFLKSMEEMVDPEFCKPFKTAPIRYDPFQPERLSEMASKDEAIV